MMFVTRYRVPSGRTKITQCFADSPEHLQEVIKARGMDEVVDDSGVKVAKPKLPSQWLDQKQYAKAMHALNWVAMVGVQAGVVSAWDLLNDEGVLHEMAHLIEYVGDQPKWPYGYGLGRGKSIFGLDGSYDPYLETHLAKVKRLCKDLEAKVPGVVDHEEPQDPKPAPFEGLLFSDYKALEQRAIAMMMEQIKTKPLQVDELRVVYDEYFDSKPRAERRKPIDAKVKAPSEKSRDFDRQRREQSQAAKDRKADLVAKLKAKAPPKEEAPKPPQTPEAEAAINHIIKAEETMSQIIKAYAKEFDDGFMRNLIVAKPPESPLFPPVRLPVQVKLDKGETVIPRISRHSLNLP
ncbi:hypothetical protein CcrC1_gp274 [Caulobacter phage C1]|nr:hypothetical protein CcrC1_gp274 [Caulobacter phage C1]UTU08503.1 hypothetical protein CcrC2_gp275 [Caulobacter phage C2]UTU10136.1 hypothetical protein CcrRB23_gp274 [Caulobacter phage RB23]WGN97170.1 hypothetical protein [Bertelyvirus sp.]WGN97688.1 hypothetical protein [Bertelyvirus sp.]